MYKKRIGGREKLQLPPISARERENGSDLEQSRIVLAREEGEQAARFRR